MGYGDAIKKFQELAACYENLTQNKNFMRKIYLMKGESEKFFREYDLNHSTDFHSAFLFEGNSNEENENWMKLLDLINSNESLDSFKNSIKYDENNSSLKINNEKYYNFFKKLMKNGFSCVLQSDILNENKIISEEYEERFTEAFKKNIFFQSINVSTLISNCIQESDYFLPHAKTKTSSNLTIDEMKCLFELILYTDKNNLSRDAADIQSILENIINREIKSKEKREEMMLEDKLLIILHKLLGERTLMLYIPLKQADRTKDNQIWDLLIFGVLSCNIDLIDALLPNTNSIIACIIISNCFKGLTRIGKSCCRMSLAKKYKSYYRKYSTLSQEIFNNLNGVSNIYLKNSLDNDHPIENNTNFIELLSNCNTKNLIVEPRIDEFIRNKHLRLLNGKIKIPLYILFILKLLFDVGFLILLSYFILIELYPININDNIHPIEILLPILSIGYVIEEIQQLYISYRRHKKYYKHLKKMAKSPYSGYKFYLTKFPFDVFSSYQKWDFNFVDLIFLITFFISIILKRQLDQEWFVIARISYGLTLIYALIKFLKFMTFINFFSHIIPAMRVVFFHILEFSVIVFLFIVTFGVVYHGMVGSWSNNLNTFGNVTKGVILPQFWRIFGELNLDQLDDDTKSRTIEKIPWIPYIIVGCYLITTSVLLMNLLIARLSNSYTDIQDTAHLILATRNVNKYIEHSRENFVPPPLNIIILFLILLYLPVLFIIKIYGGCNEHLRKDKKTVKPEKTIKIDEQRKSITNNEKPFVNHSIKASIFSSKRRKNVSYNVFSMYRRATEQALGNHSDITKKSDINEEIEKFKREIKKDIEINHKLIMNKIDNLITKI